MTKFLNISTDNTLGDDSPSDETVSSQKAIKEYVDNNSGLKNTATGGTSIYPSLTILGNDGNVTGALNIGQQTSIAAFATAVGIAATANGYGGTAFGNSARAGSQYSTSVGYHSNTSSNPGVNSTAIGATSVSTGADSVAVGYGAYANNSHAIAIGSGANATASNGAIQLGYGTNNSAGTFNVGFYSSSDPKNYQLLKYNGIIPLERMPYTAGANISISSTGEISATGGSSEASHNLFDLKWSDYELNDQSWLRADTFSWQDGTVYTDAYNHLVADYNGGTSTTETVGSYTITYVLAADGHKITTDETAVANIYTESGVAWYYILDTTNQRFKLPRTKWGFTGVRDTVGKYVAESLPNITGYTNLIRGSFRSFSGALYQRSTGTIYYANNQTETDTSSIGFDASRSSSAYQNNAPVQQRATQMYLYFYVGQFSQTATEQTAGLNTELFNGKADIDANNFSATGKSVLAGIGMPSRKYDNLTLGATGSSYIAPANGYFCLSKLANGGTQFANLINSGKNVRIIGTATAGIYIYIYIPAAKGDIIFCYYNATGKTEFLRFAYAEGDNT